MPARHVERALRRLGSRLHHQTGGHRIYVRDDPPATIPVPTHDIGPGLLRAIIRQTGVARDDFLRHL